MPSAFLPNAADLQRLLTGMSLLSEPKTHVQSLLDYGSLVEAAIENWEAKSGYVPFLADGADTTHVFESDGSRTVDLLGGFTSLTSVSVNGSACTLNTDYRAYPLNAAAKGRPITYLKFDLRWGRFFSLYAPLPGQAAPVSVTGRRGAYTLLPDSARRGILALAAIEACSQIVWMLTSGAIKNWKSGTTEEEYQKDDFAAVVASLQATVDLSLAPSSGNRRVRIA